MEMVKYLLVSVSVFGSLAFFVYTIYCVIQVIKLSAEIKQGKKKVFECGKSCVESSIQILFTSLHWYCLQLYDRYLNETKNVSYYMDPLSRFIIDSLNRSNDVLNIIERLLDNDLHTIKFKDGSIRPTQIEMPLFKVKKDENSPLGICLTSFDEISTFGFDNEILNRLWDINTRGKALSSDAKIIIKNSFKDFERIMKRKPKDVGHEELNVNFRINKTVEDNINFTGSKMYFYNLVSDSGFIKKYHNINSKTNYVIANSIVMLIYKAFTDNGTFDLLSKIVHKNIESVGDCEFLTIIKGDTNIETDTVLTAAMTNFNEIHKLFGKPVTQEIKLVFSYITHFLGEKIMNINNPQYLAKYVSDTEYEIYYVLEVK